MTVQTSKNPQVDIAEDNAFFPSEYSLSQYTSPVSDLDGVDYPKPYRGKHKILVIAADERYLPTDNGKLFSTGNHPIETLLPLYHLHAALSAGCRPSPPSCVRASPCAASCILSS